MTTENAFPDVAGARQKTAHPIVFLFLTLPLGISSGYFGLTLIYLFSNAGISVEQMAKLEAISSIPLIVSFLWAPIIDSTWSLKKWYVTSTLTTSVCMLLAAFIPVKTSNFILMACLSTLCCFVITFFSGATSGLSAHDTAADAKGRTGGYKQAGNLGGASLGGGAGIWMAEHLHHTWIPGVVLALICALCCLALFFVKEPQTTFRAKNLGKTLSNALQDVWVTIKARLGLLALVLCVLPMGTCAVAELFAPIAKEWKAGADMVALTTGVTGGVLAIAGCLIGGWICDHMHRQKAFIWFGLLQAATAVGMALCPHTPLMYAGWTLLYSFIGGLCFAAFNAFILEAAGTGAAVSKLELYGAVSMIPIVVLKWIEGKAHTRWGSSGMLLMEAGCAIASTVLFISISALIKTRSSRMETVPLA
ncbi:MAG: MFS transporter [Sphingobacteriaceae bacterium]|nr:MAG: MFS transporter [Sphingobacteriaceae bacterium]